MNSFKKYFEKAKEITDKVGLYLEKNFGSHQQILHKTDSHYSIKDDHIARKLYESYFLKETPEAVFYIEDGEKKLEGEIIWVIDPIEGTSNYNAGVPFFATQVALILKGEVVLSIVNAPVLKQAFYTTKGGGAYLNKEKIEVSKLTEVRKALVDIGRGSADSDKDWFVHTSRKLIKNVRTMRNFGGSGLDICYCAAGITDVYISNGSELYDCLAGSLILNEAGGKTLNLEGQAWNIKSTGFLGGNSALVDGVFKFLK